MASPYKIHLEAYDGPLDLLLDLIRKQEMDIHNIPIAQITGQYLEYLHKLEELDIDVSADFIYMAATLILIKSKMLLAARPAGGSGGAGRSRAPNWCIAWSSTKNSRTRRSLLYQKQQLEAHVWSKPDRSLYEGEDTEGELVVSLVDLVRVFQQVLERRKEVVQASSCATTTFTVEHMMETLREQLVMSEEGVELVAIFRVLPVALGHDLRAAGRAGDGAPAGHRADAERDLWRRSSCESIRCLTWCSPAANLRGVAQQTPTERANIDEQYSMTMTPIELKSALEAIIYAADEPATVEQLASAVGRREARRARGAR